MKKTGKKKTGGRKYSMAEQNKQKWSRMVAFISEVRQGNYPNKKTFRQQLLNTEGQTGTFACDERTLARDIDDLIHKCGAPLEYVHNSEHNGYCLSDPDWVFIHPQLNDDFVEMAMVGGRLACSMLPPEMRGKMASGVAEALSNPIRGQNFDALADGTLNCASGLAVIIDSKIFTEANNAAQQHRVVSLVYGKIDREKGEILETFDFEGHALTFNDGKWYLLGIRQKNGAREAKGERTLAVHRIKKITMLDRTFKPRKEIYEKAQAGNMFNLPMVEGVRLRSSPDLGQYFKERRESWGIKELTSQADGSVTVDLPPVRKDTVFRLVMGAGGRLRVLAPETLRAEIVAAARRIIAVNSPDAAATPVH